jgi:hypothetical protein
MMVKISDMAAVENGAAGGPQFLGRLAWFTIGDMRVNQSDLEVAFSRAGVDSKHMPNPLNARDAFRRATSKAERKNVAVPNGTKGEKLNYLMRQVKCEGNLIVRHLVRELVNENNERLEYTPIIKFALEGNSMVVENLAITTSLEYDIRWEVDKEFRDGTEYYNGRHMREVVQRVLASCDPVAVRPSGGVYFTPEKHSETVQGLTKLVEAVADHGVTSQRSRFWSIPVIDAQEHRVMVKESLEDQVKDSAAALVAEMAQLLKGRGKEGARTITQGLAAQYINKVKELARMTTEYQEMLKDNTVAANASLQAAQAQAIALLENAEVAS